MSARDNRLYKASRSYEDGYNLGVRGSDYKTPDWKDLIGEDRRYKHRLGYTHGMEDFRQQVAEYERQKEADALWDDIKNRVTDTFSENEANALCV